MTPKIKWPEAFDEGNPFGGKNGYRVIRITFHDRSLLDVKDDEKKALDILLGLANTDEVDALSFNGLVNPMISFDREKNNNNYIPIKVLDHEGNAIRFTGVYKSWTESNYISRLTGFYSSHDEERNNRIIKEILEVKSHDALNRDVFVSTSDILIKNRENLEECNICTPKEALKIIGLYLRMKGNMQWISHRIGNATYTTSRQSFYQAVTRGLLPNSWKYISELSLASSDDELRSLGWSALHRYSLALQARDEIGRLFYMPSNVSKDDQTDYHFDFLTLLLTAIFDVQALIIKRVHNLDIDDRSCGFRRSPFINAVEGNDETRNVFNIIETNKEFIDILSDLRNKIHSISLKSEFDVPESDPDILLDRICQYGGEEVTGIKRSNIKIIKNGSDPIPSITYSLEKYVLAHFLVNEATELIKSIMDATNTEIVLDESDLGKVNDSPPEYMIPSIETFIYQI